MARRRLLLSRSYGAWTIGANAMPTELPLACTLTADQLPARLAEMSALGQERLVSADRDGRRAVLRFRPGADTRSRLEAIVRAERQCCAFLGFELSEEPASRAGHRGPAGGEPVLDELVAAFATRTS